MEEIFGAYHQGTGRCLEVLVTHLHPDRADKHEGDLVLTAVQVGRYHTTRVQPDPQGRRQAGEPLAGDLDAQPPCPRAGGT
jgi:hypothetical protein